MVFDISQSSNSKLMDFYNKAIKELEEFYEVNWNKNRPAVFLVNSREDIDMLRGEETEDWIVGFTKGSKSCVFLLDPKNYETESRHKYSEENYFSTMKHELSHLYSRILYDGYKPTWLTEGIAVYSADQLKFHPIPKEFKVFLKYYDWGGSGIYAESGFAVKILIDQFGKEKFLNFYKKLGSINNKEELKELFQIHYNAELTYDFFNKYLEL
jgi:hypothetical protein